MGFANWGNSGSVSEQPPMDSPTGCNKVTAINKDGDSIERQLIDDLEKPGRDLITGQKDETCDWAHFVEGDEPPCKSKAPSSQTKVVCNWPLEFWRQEDSDSVESEIVSVAMDKTVCDAIRNRAKKKDREEVEKSCNKVRVSESKKPPTEKQRSHKDICAEIAKDDYSLRNTCEKEIQNALQRVSSGNTKREKEVRQDFWQKINDYLEHALRTGKEAQAHRNDWDLHVVYFAQVIGPMVEEALYINEMLNQMKQFLRATVVWANSKFAEQKAPWPENAKGNLGKPSVGTQEVDLEDSAYKKKGYNKDHLVRPTGDGTQHSYYEEIDKEGKDRVLGITMFEYIRRQAIKRNNNPSDFRVMFGSFVRTDRPSGDPDCSGAQASLQFAQELTDLLTENVGPSDIDLMGQCASVGM